MGARLKLKTEIMHKWFDLGVTQPAVDMSNNKLKLGGVEVAEKLDQEYVRR